MEPFKINLSVSLLGYEEELERNKDSLEKAVCYNDLFRIAENCDYLHIDIIRDDFVKGINRFISPLYLSIYNLLKEKSKFEFHFMVNSALPHISYMNFKIDREKRDDIRIILPIESNREPDKSLEVISSKDNDLFDVAEKISYLPLKKRIIKLDSDAKEKVLENLIFIKQCGYRTGISIEPSTNLNGISSKLFENVDCILFMGVASGKSGQTYRKDISEKIKSFSENASNCNIAVDGGVKLDLISELIRSGADSLVIGSYIINSKDIESTILGIKKEFNKTVDEILTKPECANKRIAYLTNFS